MIRVFNLEAQSNEFKAFVNDCFKEFKRKFVSVEIIESDSRRSLDQNALYWGQFVPQVSAILNNLTGEKYNNEDAHEFLKYNMATKIYPDGKYYKYVSDKGVIDQDKFEQLTVLEAKEYRQIFNMPSTAKMTKVKFSEYLELITKWAAEAGFQI